MKQSKCRYLNIERADNLLYRRYMKTIKRSGNLRLVEFILPDFNNTAYYIYKKVSCGKRSHAWRREYGNMTDYAQAKSLFEECVSFGY